MKTKNNIRPTQTILAIVIALIALAVIYPKSFNIGFNYRFEGRIASVDTWKSGFQIKTYFEEGYKHLSYISLSIYEYKKDGNLLWEYNPYLDLKDWDGNWTVKFAVSEYHDEDRTDFVLFDLSD